MRERGLYEPRPDVSPGIKGRVGAASQEPPARRQRGSSLERSRKGGGGAGGSLLRWRLLGRFPGVGEGGGPPGREPGTLREGPATPVSVAGGWRIRQLPLPDQLTRTRDARCPPFHCALHPEHNRAKPAHPGPAQRGPRSRAWLFREGAVCARRSEWLSHLQPKALLPGRGSPW